MPSLIMISKGRYVIKIIVDFDFHLFVNIIKSTVKILRKGWGFIEIGDGDDFGARTETGSSDPIINLEYDIRK